MVELNRRLAAEYESENPGVKLEITASDSTQGIADLIASKTDIAASSRATKPEESAKGKMTGIPVARDGVVIYVNPANKIISLTVQQVADIFSGRATNWKQVGGADAPITVYVRETSSGTAEYFREHALGSKSASYAAGAKEINNAAGLIDAVAKDPNGIGYAGAVTSRTAKALALKKDATAAAIPPTRDAVKRGDYALTRVLYYYVGVSPRAEVQKFTQWVLSPAGQAAVTKAGFFAAR